MSKVIESLTNNNYRVLKLLHDNQVELDGKRFIAMTQVEIAYKLDLSKVTINAIMKDLQTKDLVQPYENKRGVYQLTDTARSIISEMDNLSRNLKG